MNFTLSTVNTGSPDPLALATFYGELLGWENGVAESDWVVLRNPDGGVSLAFQLEVDHVRPVWPAGPGDQQMQVHLEVQVDELGPAVDRALELGATLATHQPQDDVRVCLDPDGHPFCLWIET